MELAFLYADWLGKPAWMWLGFLGIVATLLILDLSVLHKETREIEVKESLLLSVGYSGLSQIARAGGDGAPVPLSAAQGWIGLVQTQPDVTGFPCRS